MAHHSPVIGRYVTFEVDGLEYTVFYEENGSGQPMLCQHTAGSHGRQWRHLLEDEEVTSRYRVIAYDLPRHGKSSPPANAPWWSEEYRLTADHFVRFVLGFCDALGLETPLFMGTSMGGNVALQLALRHPERFSAVIAVAGAIHAPGLYMDIWHDPRANAGQVGASGCWDLMAPMSPLSEKWLTWHYSAQGGEVFKGDLYFYSVDHDLRDHLDAIDGRRCPVVMMAGSYDWLTCPDDLAEPARRIRGCKLIGMDDIGHFPMSENYPLFRSHLLEALKHIEAHPPRGAGGPMGLIDAL